MKFPVFLKESWVYLGAGRLDVTKISSPFHQYHSRDQHKLNFGTKFLLGGRLWQPAFSGHFSNYYSQVTIHHFTIYHFRSPFVILRSVTIHVTLFIPGGKTLFMHLIHFIVNGVYGYSYSRNRLGLAAKSCIISKSISYGLEIVCISSRGHLHTIPLVSFTH